MVSLRFPFSFSQSSTSTLPSPNSPPFRASTLAVTVAATAAVATIAATAAASASTKDTGATPNPKHPFLQEALNFFFANRSLPLWGSLSLANSADPVVHSRTGVSFPSILADSRKLLGIGLRRKSVLGLKNIDVYAFGVYADNNEVKKMLGEKYKKLSSSEIKESKEFTDDLIENDISMTVRLQIMYSKLSIRSVRNAFEESVGSRLQKFGGPDNKELLQRFTSQFKDEYKIPRGSVIELARERGYVLRTTIDGKEVGSIQSKLLCKSILDLYIGEDPFDKQAKEDVKHNVASLLQE
ncbi:fatty-acid-binding protein 1 [Cannabis sativa]|uniref:Fatty acid binding protein-like protein n=1 Tax=Cannabis sativa TaxID=3483 RepID=A0A7D5HHI8_CANSA|nr:fatty-acid-binding protein 1 [Cannabis sativa]QKZ93266.1 fatty acid binding protein-like protein [Cannabis sativa]